MSFVDSLAAAKADLDAKKAAYDAAQATYDALLAQSVGDGLDASEFQGDIDWTKVKASGVGFAFIRSADGDYNDARYSAARVAAIRTAGLPFGVYQFARVASDSNNQRDGRAEAAMAYYFATRQGWGRPGDLPLVYDFEGDSYAGQSAAKSAAHLVQAVSTLRAIMGRPAILYTNPSTMSFVGPALDDAGRIELARCPLWVAHWDVAAPTVPAPWTTWTFWQYSKQGTVSGITGSVDRDRFSGSKTDLDAIRL